MTDAVTTRWKLQRGSATRLKHGENQTIAWSEVTSELAQAALLRFAMVADPSVIEDWPAFKASLKEPLPYWVTEANADLVSALVKLTGLKKASIEAKLAGLNPGAIETIRSRPEVKAILSPVSLDSLL